MAKDETDIGANVDVCKNCGEPLEPDIKFCIKCGTPINGTPETALEPELQSEADELLKQDEPLAAQPLPEQEQIEPPPAEPVLAPPTQEPVYQAESYAPTSDIPFPDVPETPPEAVLQRQQPRQAGIFVSGILGFVVMVVLLLGVFAAGLLNYNFTDQANLQNILLQLLILGTISFAAVITSRAKGPDISVGAVMAFAAVLTVAISGSWIVGLVLAVLVCAAIGAVNGLLIVYLKVPALLMGVVISSLLRGITYMIGSSRPNLVGDEIKIFTRLQVSGLPIIPLAVFAFVFILTFLIIIITKLGKPLSNREPSDNKSLSYFFAYLLSSVIACAAGVLIMSRIKMANVNIGFGNELFILYIFAAITSSKFLDNRVLPAFYAIIAAILYVVVQNVMPLYGLDSFVQQIIFAVITLGFVVVSYIARKDTFKGLVQRM